MDVGRQGRISHIRWATHIDPLGPPVGVDCLLVAHGRLPTGEQPIPSDGPHTWLCNTICDCMCGCIYVGVYGCIWMSVHVCGYVCARASGCGCGCGCVCMLYRCILPGPSPPGQEVKRSRGYGGYGGVTHAHTDRPVAHHGRPPTGELRRQGPTGPSSALSPVPLALGPPPPIPLRQLANWPAASRQPNSPPNSPPNSLPPAEANRPQGQGHGHGQCANESGSEPGSPTSPTSPGKPGLDSTRLELASTRLELASTRAPCDTPPPPP